MSTTAPVVIAIMVTTFPQNRAAIPLWILVWSIGGLGGIALMDSTVYGMALYHTIGADIYLGTGAVLIAILVIAILGIMAIGGARHIGNILKADTFGPDAR